MKNIKLTYIPDSHGWLKVYLKAENAELAEAWFNSFWNHEATSQDAPEWIFENELAFAPPRKSCSAHWKTFTWL